MFSFQRQIKKKIEIVAAIISAREKVHGHPRHNSMNCFVNLINVLSTCSLINMLYMCSNRIATLV